MKLFKFFKPKSKKELFSGHCFDFHEDDFCRVEMRPVENLNEIKEDLKQIQNINENHSSNNGFTKVHVIKEGQVKLIDRRIQLAELELLMTATGLRKFDSITTGYGSQVYKSEYSVGFGRKGCAILCERNQNLVDHIWFDYHPLRDNNEVIEILAKYIYGISAKWNLVLVDWNQSVIVDSRNKEILMAYLTGEFER